MYLMCHSSVFIRSHAGGGDPGFRRGGRRSSTDEDEEYESERRVTPVRDTIDRIKQFADSELITLSPHEVDYDSDEAADVDEGYLGYEADDDFSYPARPILEKTREYEGAFSVRELPLYEEKSFLVNEYDLDSVLKEKKNKN